MKVIPIKNALRLQGDSSLLVEVTTITPEAAAQWLKSNLRQMLVRDAQRLTSYPAEIKMKMVVKAWNLRRRGRDDTTRQAVALGPHDPDRIPVL